MSMANDKQRVSLTKTCRQYRNLQVKRIHDYRSKPHTAAQKEKTREDCWDLPIVVVSCASSNCQQIVSNGRNSSRLKTPGSVVKCAYSNILGLDGKPSGMSVTLGKAPDQKLKALFGFSGKHANIAGRCAEPHAANGLENKLAKKKCPAPNLSELVFSDALDVATGAVKPYCPTCQMAFPQLRK